MPDRPNILFLMTDHTNREALDPANPCLTPALDSMAAQGRRFSRCYTTNAICSPARASLMTSLYASTHGMWDCTHTQRKEWVDVPASRFHYFSQDFADAGYDMGYFGKWHVEQSCRLEDFGWKEYDLHVDALKGERLPEPTVSVPKEGYSDYLFAAVSAEENPRHPAFVRAGEFLRRHARERAGRPFFCFVSTSEPHDPYVPPKPFFDLYDLAAIPLPETLRSESAGKPEVIRRMRAVWKDMSDDQWRLVRACYWALISFIDAEIGRLLAELKELALDDNTIIVFTSDHGDMQGAQGLTAKGVGTSYEQVYNIPLIIRVPGQAPSEDRTTVTSLVDLAPTLLDYCGLPSLDKAHGRSLRQVFEGRADPAEWDSAYGEFFGQRFVYTQRIVWHRNWKYVFSPGGIDELYDLGADPFETTNLADDPAHRDKLHELCRRMWQKMQDIGDDSLFRTQYATLRTAPVGPYSIR